MNNAHTVIECTTVEEADRALYLGHSVRCSEELALQLGIEVDPDIPQAWTQEELEESVERPYGDEEPPPPGSEYEEILRISGTARKRGLLAGEKLLPEHHDPSIPMEPGPAVPLRSAAAGARPETGPPNPRSLATAAAARR